MSVDLAKLPADEEWLRCAAWRLPRTQNVLDALNLFRCRALFAEQELERANASKSEAWAAVRVRDEEINVTVKRLRDELERANAELIEVRNSAEHNRIFGGSYGRV